MSHFVSSEIPDDPINPAQIERFEAARAAFPNLNDVARQLVGNVLARAPDLRSGAAGLRALWREPDPGQPNPMRAVVTLSVAIQQTRWIEPGKTCGYNAQWTAKRRTRLATLLAGYADGLPRGAGATDGSRAPKSAVAGRRCPLVGRVSMDFSSRT